MKNITGPHCESCGSTDPENISNLVDTEGYTRCCNEPVAICDRYQTNWRTGKGEYVPVPCADFGQCYHD